MKFERWVPAVDHEDWIFEGLVHLQVTKVTTSVIKQEQKNQSSLFMENFFWNLLFFQGKNNHQKKRLGSETLKPLSDPGFLPSQQEDTRRLPQDRSPEEVQEASSLPAARRPQHCLLWLPCRHLPSDFYNPHLYAHLNSQKPGKEIAWVLNLLCSRHSLQFSLNFLKFTVLVI